MKTKDKLSFLVFQSTHSLELPYLYKTVYFQIQLSHYLGTWRLLWFISSVCTDPHYPDHSCWAVSSSRIGVEQHMF